MHVRLILCTVFVTVVPVQLAYMPDPFEYGKKSKVLRGTPGSFGDAGIELLDMKTPQCAAALVRQWPQAATPSWKGYRFI